jgi:proline iminopeptidase
LLDMIHGCLGSVGLVLIAGFLACSEHEGRADKGPSSGGAGAAIDTAYFVPLGGLEQYIEVRGASGSLPLLLYLHGGPSMPATPMLRFHNAGLSEIFIVVSWDQRGCGHSARSDPRPADMTLERFIEDAHELTGHLKQIYGRERLFLVGHSWGSIMGMELISRYPDDYIAYIGVGQVVNTAEGEARSRRELAGRARARKDSVTLRALEDIGWEPGRGYTAGLEGFLAHRRLLWQQRMHDYDPTAMIRAIEASEDYSNDISEWMASAMYAQGAVYETLMSVDFTDKTDLRIPVYFFAGRHDFNTPQDLVAEYLETVSAPLKRLYWFDQSGHSPPWEEPQLFAERLREVAREVLGIADVPPAGG